MADSTPKTSDGEPVANSALLDGESSRTGGPLGMMAWLATEGGRKCPMCGRYAKEAELGNLSQSFRDRDGSWCHISMYGHLPGFGCNQEASNVKQHEPEPGN